MMTVKCKMMSENDGEGDGLVLMMIIIRKPTCIDDADDGIDSSCRTTKKQQWFVGNEYGDGKVYYDGEDNVDDNNEDEYDHEDGDDDDDGI